MGKVTRRNTVERRGAKVGGGFLGLAVQPVQAGAHQAHGPGNGEQDVGGYQAGQRGDNLEVERVVDRDEEHVEPGAEHDAGHGERAGQQAGEGGAARDAAAHEGERRQRAEGDADGSGDERHL